MEEGAQVIQGREGKSSIAWLPRPLPSHGRSTMGEGVQLPQPGSPVLGRPSVEKRDTDFPVWLPNDCPFLDRPVMDEVVNLSWSGSPWVG